jgi:hypothetical protein
MLQVKMVQPSSSADEPARLLCDYAGTLMPEVLQFACEQDLRRSMGSLWAAAKEACAKEEAAREEAEKNKVVDIAAGGAWSETGTNSITCGTRPDKCNLTQAGKKYKVLVQNCSGNCNGTVWGIDPFTADSSLCRTARFKGIDVKQPFWLTATGPNNHSDAGTSNGVTTVAYGAWPQNFSLSQ